MKCPFCGTEVENSYQLIDHEESCAARWAHRKPPAPVPAPTAPPTGRPHNGFSTLTFAWGKTTVIPLISAERKVFVQMADLSFKDSDSPELATLTLTDALGDVTTPDIPPTWVGDDAGAVIGLAVSSDGLSATASPVAVGTSNVTITVTDNDGTVVTGVSVVTVTAGEAAALTVAWAPVVPVVTPPVA